MPPIYPQPYTFPLSSLPEEAKKVLGQWSNSHSKVMRSRGPTARPSPPPHRYSNPAPSCANLYISMCCSSGIPSTLLRRVHIPPCQPGCPLGKGCGKDRTGHLCGSSPASQHWAVAQLFPREGGLEQKVSGWGLDLGGLQQPGEVAGLGGKGRLRQCCHLLVSPVWLSPHCHLTKPRAHLETLCCNSGLWRCPQRRGPVLWRPVPLTGA